MKKNARMERPAQRPAPGRRAPWFRAAALALAAFCCWIAPPSATALELSDVPIFSRVIPPPANIMFLLDDSGSMNFDILVRGQYDGSFPDPTRTPEQLAIDAHGFCYVFDNPGDNVYPQTSQPLWYAGPNGRKYWKSQWYKVNVLYYNPWVQYAPWPSYGTVVFPNADPDVPRSHPVRNPSLTVDLQATSFSVGGVNVPIAHYFVFSAAEEVVYLVVLDRPGAAIRYYRATVSGTGLAETVTALTPVAQPPADIVTGRSYAAERQNFANWFSYFRRREFVAKNAIARVIQSMAGVRMGFYGINQRIVATLEPVMVQQGATITDRSHVLLAKLYDYVSSGGTPLKRGLHTVGQFYKDNTGVLGGLSGPKPYDATVPGAACQQSFTVILTDGYYSDLSYVASGVGNADGDNGHPFADASSGTLADIAMHYYENDLNALPNSVPVSRYDRATHQHMATYAVAFGVSGTLDPADYDTAFLHRTTGQPIQWPAVTGNYSPTAIDDLWHATVNGRGRFLNANNPEELATALSELARAIQEILIGSSSSVTVNGDFLFGKLGADTVIYQGVYSNRDDEWTGDVRAFRLDPATGDIVASPLRWSAAERLNARNPDTRRIATYSGSAGIPFRHDSLTAELRGLLGSPAADLVRYLRGEEIAGFRVRSSKLGDIVNSAPVFVAEETGGVIYCGANDGMLHAFDAASGEELFAYIPRLLFGQLRLLADPGYRHRFYVDLTPTVVRGPGVLGGDAVKTLLVGGLRQGGKGYFALDVSAPQGITSESALAGRVLWEFPAAADPDLGYTYSRPVVVRTNSSEHPWLVIFGNGYGSESGGAVLYLVDPASGGLVRKIPAGSGPENGLSSPLAVDVTFDGKVDFIYAGDLKGNLWKFDLSRPSVAEWGVAYSDGAAPRPLFQARGPGDAEQPITTRPDAMLHPEKHGLLIAFGTGRLLGDGDLSDPSVQSIYVLWDYGDRVYSARSRTWSPDDDREFLGTFLRPAGLRLSNQPDTVSLLRQTQKTYTVMRGALEQRFRVISRLEPVWVTAADPTNGQRPDLSGTVANHAGFFMDLDPGERVISDVILRGGVLLAVGFLPNSDPCGPGGNSMFMEINAFTGGRLEGGVLDITDDRRVDPADVIRVDFDGDGVLEEVYPSGLEFGGNLQPPAILRLGDGGMERKYLSSSSGTIEVITERGPRLGVTYWMEVRY